MKKINIVVVTLIVFLMIFYTYNLELPVNQSLPTDLFNTSYPIIIGFIIYSVIIGIQKVISH